MLASTTIPVKYQHIPQCATIRAIYATAPAQYTGKPQRVHVLDTWTDTSPKPQTFALVQALFPQALAYVVTRDQLYAISAFVNQEME
jgi:hypothetical protein